MTRKKKKDQLLSAREEGIFLFPVGKGTHTAMWNGKEQESHITHDGGCLERNASSFF